MNKENKNLDKQQNGNDLKADVSTRLLKQPKWVQHEFNKKERQLEELKYKLAQAEKANEITSDMDWFTLGFHMKEARALFILHKDAASKVATIGEGTIMLVGRPKNGC